MHKTLTNWRAKRAGARITVYGTGEGGQPTKVPNIDTIEPAIGYAIATDKDGATHRLLTS